MPATDLLETYAKDGSRHFLDLRSSKSAKTFWRAAEGLPGARCGDFIRDFTENWFDFTYEDASFSVHEVFGQEFWFFANTPVPDDSVLHEVTRYYTQFGKPWLPDAEADSETTG